MSPPVTVQYETLPFSVTLTCPPVAFSTFTTSFAVLSLPSVLVGPSTPVMYRSPLRILMLAAVSVAATLVVVVLTGAALSTLTAISRRSSSDSRPSTRLRDCLREFFVVLVPNSVLKYRDMITFYCA